MDKKKKRGFLKKAIRGVGKVALGAATLTPPGALGYGLGKLTQAREETAKQQGRGKAYDQVRQGVINRRKPVTAPSYRQRMLDQLQSIPRPAAPGPVADKLRDYLKPAPGAIPRQAIPNQAPRTMPAPRQRMPAPMPNRRLPTPGTRVMPLPKRRIPGSRYPGIQSAPQPLRKIRR